MRGRVTLGQGRPHDDGLESRTRLAPRLGGAVEREAAEVGSTRQGAERSGFGVERDDGALHGLLPFQKKFFKSAVHLDHAPQKKIAFSEPFGVDVSGKRHLRLIVPDNSAHHLRGDVQNVKLESIPQARRPLDFCSGTHEPASLVNFLDSIDERFVSGFLQTDVNGRMNLQATFIQGLPKPATEAEAGFLDEIGGFRRDIGHPGNQLDRFFASYFSLFLGNEPRSQHPLDYQITSFQCFLGVGFGAESRRSFGQSCNHGGFGQSELSDRFSKIDLGRRLYPVRPAAEIDLIHIKFEYFIFREASLNLEGEKRFPYFSLEFSLGRQKRELSPIAG